MNAAYVYAGVRTPFGKYDGGLKSVRPDDLAAIVIAGLLAKVPELEPATISEVYWGNANGAGEDNRNVGRMAVLLAGLPTSIPATTINRLCGSSLDAVMQSSRAIETGDAEVIIAGGVESMTRSPWVLPKPDRGFPVGNLNAVSTALGWRLVNPEMPDVWTASLGECNEQVAERLDVSRARQDEFAARSHELAGGAWADGFYDDIVVSVPGVEVVKDESIRAGTTADKLSGLKPAFRKDGRITAGNASPLSDGASALVIGNQSVGKKLEVKPLARIAGRGAHALDPQDFGLAPIEAANKALAAAGISWRDVSAVEVNEAFAVQTLACLDAWGISEDIVNTKGGAIAIGHPLGASGGRIVSTLAKRLAESGDRWGVAAICIGVGQGLAVVLENPEAS